MSKITYTDKVTLNENPDVADIYKVKASDLNEIKNVVNANDDKFNYTQEEQRIGTWIDGKPLYRKVIIWSQNDYIQQNTVMSLAHGISNLNEVIKCNGMVKWDNIFMPMTTHYQNQQNEIAINTIDNNNINFTSYNENWGATRIVFILEYTKTTD